MHYLKNLLCKCLSNFFQDLVLYILYHLQENFIHNILLKYSLTILRLRYLLYMLTELRINFRQEQYF